MYPEMTYGSFSPGGWHSVCTLGSELYLLDLVYHLIQNKYLCFMSGLLTIKVSHEINDR